MTASLTHDLKTGRKPEPATHLPPALAEVSLVDARTCAAAGDVSLSWWHDKVRIGEAPKPAIQQPRFTRWRMADVRAFWAQRAAACSAESAVRMTAQAVKASAAAKKLRTAPAAA